MKREDVTRIFPKATEEQITEFLNKSNAEIQAEKEKAKDLKDTAKELEQAQAEIEALKLKAESGAPDDWQSQIEKLTDQNNKAQQIIRDMQLKSSLVKKGFSDEDADEFIKTMNEGGDIADVLGKLKDNAISEHDKAQLKNTPDPSGSGSTPPTDEKTTAEKLATGIFGDSNAINQSDILANYK